MIWQGGARRNLRPHQRANAKGSFAFKSVHLSNCLEAHRELAALCVSSGYILRFDGCLDSSVFCWQNLTQTSNGHWRRFESLPSGFRCVFRCGVCALDGQDRAE